MSAEHSTPFRVEVASPARRALSALPHRIAHAVIEFISGPLAENPLRLSKPLAYELEGLRSARRGDYRVLIRVDEEQRIVLIVDIGHRAHIYRT